MSFFIPGLVLEWDPLFWTKSNAEAPSRLYSNVPIPWRWERLTSATVWALSAVSLSVYNYMYKLLLNNLKKKILKHILAPQQLPLLPEFIVLAHVPYKYTTLFYVSNGDII